MELIERLGVLRTHSVVDATLTLEAEMVNDRLAEKGITGLATMDTGRGIKTIYDGRYFGHWTGTTSRHSIYSQLLSDVHKEIRQANNNGGKV